MSPFVSEAALADALLQLEALSLARQRPGWQTWAEPEVSGLAGRPDFVMSFVRQTPLGRFRVVSIAFEVKLSDWRRALRQAYRYRSFSHYSYVILDEAHVDTAVRNLALFRRSNVGLLSYSEEHGLRRHYRPEFSAPYSGYLRQRLNSFAVTSVFEA